MKKLAEKLIVKTIWFETHALGEGLVEQEKAFRIKISIVLDILGHHYCSNYYKCNPVSCLYKNITANWTHFGI